MVEGSPLDIGARLFSPLVQQPEHSLQMIVIAAEYQQRRVDLTQPLHRDIFAHRILAKLPTIAAAAYKLNSGQPFVYPRHALSSCENLLQMFFAVPAEPYEIDPIAAEALDLLFILHADHEQNCSTSTVRMAGSSGANPYSAIATGISAL